MKLLLAAICVVSIASVFPQSVAMSAQIQPPADLGTQVREVFAVKCVQCHGPTVLRPKGKFGYILDLGRVAQNAKILVPFNPAASKLWTQIDDGDMPPDDAKAGQLSDAEKQLIHLWVEAGAPAPLTPSLAAASTAISPDPQAQPLPKRILQLLGKLHVLVIHFPIALIAAAAIAESVWIFQKRAGMSPAVRFCVLLGAAGAIVAAVLGWIHASYGGFGAESGHDLQLHRWLGTAATLGAVLAAVASELDTFVGRRSLLFRGVLFASAAVVGAAGHFGGMLVYGSDFFRF
jgi:mono/diheme cytochrome c family protein/uncharacterized membrane protein